MPDAEQKYPPALPGEEEPLPPAGTALVIPLLIGCAITAVAVILGHAFVRQRAESRARARAEKARTFLKRSIEAMKRRDYRAAQEAADAALELSRAGGGVPGDLELQSTAYLFRAEARSGRNARPELEAAVEDYSRCLELRPSAENRFLAFYGKGQVLYRLGRYAEAEKSFTEALAVNRYSAVAYGARAMARRRLGREREAARDERRALELGWGKEEAEPVP